MFEQMKITLTAGVHSLGDTGAWGVDLQELELWAGVSLPTELVGHPPPQPSPEVDL